MTSVDGTAAFASRIAFGTGAPGVVTNGVLVGLAVVALIRGSERTQEIGSIAVIGFAWMLLLLFWLGWFVAGIGYRAIAWSRPIAVASWLVVPAMFIALSGIVFSGLAFNVRFTLSRSALEAAAQAAQHVPQAPGWIGLYDIKAIEVGDEGTRLWVSDAAALVRTDGSGSTDPSSIAFEPIDDDWSIRYQLLID